MEDEDGEDYLIHLDRISDSFCSEDTLDEDVFEIPWDEDEEGAEASALLTYGHRYSCICPSCLNSRFNHYGGE